MAYIGEVIDEMRDEIANLKAENARLTERVRELEEELAKQKFITERLLATIQSRQSRLAQAEGLLKKWDGQVLDFIESGKGEQLRKATAAFLHPEQADHAKAIEFMNGVSAEVATWPTEKKGLLDSHATGYEREKP